MIPQTKKRTDKQQNRRLDRLSREVADLRREKRKESKKKQPRQKVARAMVMRRSRGVLPDVVLAAPSAEQKPAAITANHIPPASLPAMQHSRLQFGVPNADRASLIILPMTCTPLQTTSNRVVPQHAIYISISSLNGTIGAIQQSTIVNPVVTPAMINRGEDSIKINGLEVTLQYDGSQAFRQGRAFFINPPGHHGNTNMESAVNAFLSSPSLANFTAMESAIINNRYARQYNFNTSQTFTEPLIATHRWGIVDANASYLNIGDSLGDASADFTYASVNYNVPLECAYIYIPPLTGATTLPNITITCKAGVEWHLSNHEGLLRPTHPPSPVINSLVHSAQNMFHAASNSPDLPLASAVQQHDPTNPLAKHTTRQSLWGKALGALTSKKGIAIEEEVGMGIASALL